MTGLVHNLSGQLYSNPVVSGGACWGKRLGEESSFKATLFSIDTLENRIKGQFKMSVLLTQLQSW